MSNKFQWGELVRNKKTKDLGYLRTIYNSVIEVEENKGIMYRTNKNLVWHEDNIEKVDERDLDVIIFLATEQRKRNDFKKYKMFTELVDIAALEDFFEFPEEIHEEFEKAVKILREIDTKLRRENWYQDPDFWRSW